ncbi:MAG: AraC family transcriptional regulator [Victivallales bacterium]|nr:AraC family transcriptional regulator [Victivallales bacterium]
MISRKLKFKRLFSETPQQSQNYWLEKSYLPFHNSDILHLLAYGESTCHPGCQTTFTHPYWSLQLVTQGTGLAQCGRQRRQLAPGTFLLLPPETACTVKASAGNALERRSLLVANGQCMGLLCRKGVLSSELVFRLTSAERVAVFYDQVKKEVLTAATADCAQSLSGFIYLMLMELISQVGRMVAPSNDFRSILKTIDSLPPLACSLGEVARHHHTCVRTLHRLFQQHLHCTPGQYILKMRLENARQLLAQPPPMAIQDVAADVGFRSPSHFIRMFRRQFGQTPKQFQEQQSTTCQRAD